MKHSFWQKNYRYRGRQAMPLVLGIAGAMIGGPLLGALIGAKIGAAVGFMVGSMIGSYLFMKTPTAISPKVGSYPIQTASKGNPVNIVYGKRKIAGNIIWMGKITRYTENV